MYLYRILFLIVLFLFGNHTWAQQEISNDSLESLKSKSFEHVYAYDFKNAIIVSSLLVDKAFQKNNNYYTSIGYTRLASTYLSMKDTASSLRYYKKALEFAKQTKRDTFVASVYNDIGNLYMETGGSLERASFNFEKSLALNTQGKRSEKGLLANYINIAWTHLELKNPNKAHPFLVRASEILTKKELHPLYKINLNTLFGRYYFQKENFEAASQLLNEAAFNATEHNFLKEAATAQKTLSAVYQDQGNLEASIISLKKETQLNQKLQKIINQQQLLEASAKFKVDHFQKDSEEAEHKKVLADALASKSKLLTTVFVITTVVMFLAALSALLLYRNRKKYLKDLNIKNKELIKAKEEAERLTKSKTQFFSTISHELRTPLYGVIGLSSILLEDEKLGEHKDDLKSLKFSADYLLALINDVLTLNKADSQGIKLEKTPFSLSQLLKSITSSFAFRIEQNKNILHLNIAGNVPDRLIGDSVKLSQILMNIVGNAVKFTESGTIDIKVEVVKIKENGFYSLLFSVIDDGIGIPEEKQKQIFEEFAQVKNQNYNYQGTGLGLPIVKKLLAIHNSEISLKSEVGLGSKFSFIIDFEIANISEAIEAKEADVEISKNAFENMSILIVDDNKINQKVTQKILDTRHFKCTVADDGAEAIDKAKNNHFNLILMDVHMPNVDGIEATIAIRKFNPTVPIIALTAVEVDEMKAKIMSSGMNDIIGKPYDVSQFLTTILRHLSVDN